ncbi:MAG: SDR family NAD(P)-dependent oxidoreductase, partial [Anaerolineae bacterium]
PPRTTDEPIHPVEHYARHKAACEEMIRASGLRWAILRLAATFPLALKLDPGMFDVPPDNRMEFVHTRDVGLALANAAGSDAIWGKTLLIGGGPTCQHIFGDMVARIMGAMGLEMLPREAFATVPFATDWLDTAESQRLLRYQTRTLDDYLRDMTRLLGPRLFFVRLFKSLVRRSLLAQSPHWRRHLAQRRGQAWAGKTALVTGASSGIGAAVARALARQGVRVLLTARRAERLELLADEIRRDGGEAHAIAADLTDEAERGRVLARARELAGGVDILVNSAGLGWYGYGSDMPWDVAREMIQTNMAALAHLTLLVLREMQARGTGHIINISSIAGSLPEQGTALYSATKSFVDSFTTALHRELRGTAVRISLLRPGPVQTEFFARAAGRADGRRVPGERLAISPERVARRVLALLRRPRRVAYVPGWLRVTPWIEPAFGWIIDLISPALLQRSAVPTPPGS